jgi:hypothetical protein
LVVLLKDLDSSWVEICSDIEKEFLWRFGSIKYASDFFLNFLHSKSVCGWQIHIYPVAMQMEVAPSIWPNHILIDLCVLCRRIKNIERQLPMLYIDLLTHLAFDIALLQSNFLQLVRRNGKFLYASCSLYNMMLFILK